MPLASSISLVLVVTTGLVWRLSCSGRSCLSLISSPATQLLFLLLASYSSFPPFPCSISTRASIIYSTTYSCPLCLFARYTPFDITTSIYPRLLQTIILTPGWSDLTFSLKSHFLAYRPSTGDHIYFHISTIDYSIFDSYISDRLISPPPLFSSRQPAQEQPETFALRFSTNPFSLPSRHPAIHPPADPSFIRGSPLVPRPPSRDARDRLTILPFSFLPFLHFPRHNSLRRFDEIRLCIPSPSPTHHHPSLLCRLSSPPLPLLVRARERAVVRDRVSATVSVKSYVSKIPSLVVLPLALTYSISS